jgi:hypothetical protein
VAAADLRIGSCPMGGFDAKVTAQYFLLLELCYATRLLHSSIPSTCLSCDNLCAVSQITASSLY